MRFNKHWGFYANEEDTVLWKTAEEFEDGFEMDVVVAGQRTPDAYVLTKYLINSFAEYEDGIGRKVYAREGAIPADMVPRWIQLVER